MWLRTQALEAHCLVSNPSSTTNRVTLGKMFSQYVPQLSHLE